MRIAGVEPESIVDGPGIRFTVFAQGCPLRCPGCQNPGTWDPCGGREVEVADLVSRMQGSVLASGLTLSGGEASRQPEPCTRLARAAHRLGWDVWAWSGFTVEALQRQARGNSDLSAMLEEIDVLVDGPFQLARRTLTLPWRGSSNQRVIDMVATRRTGSPVEWEQAPAADRGASAGRGV